MEGMGRFGTDGEVTGVDIGRQGCQEWSFGNTTSKKMERFYASSIPTTLTINDLQ